MAKIIYIKNQHGKEIPWKVENELKNMYEVFYDFIVTHIDKTKVYLIKQNNKIKFIYDGAINLPENHDVEVTGIF